MWLLCYTLNTITFKCLVWKMVLEIILEKNREELMMEAWHVLRKDKEGLLPHLLFLWLQPSKFFRAGRHCPPTWKPHKCSILINHFLSITRASLVTQVVKNLPAIWKTWVPSLGWEDLLEKRSATYSSILVWRIPWTEEPGRLLSTGSQRMGHNWVTFTFILFTSQFFSSGSEGKWQIRNNLATILEDL